MIARTSLHLIAAIVFAGAAAHAHAAETGTLPTPKPCDRQQYPAEAVRLKEEGITEIGFLIGTDGIVKQTVILNPSGSATLDQAARQILSTCVFRPASSNGQPLAAWEVVSYNWSFEDDPEMSSVKMRLAGALQRNKDDAAALYYSAMLKLRHGASDADPDQARALVRRAADLGHPHAQYRVAAQYEKGYGVQADPAEALRWYRKAAAQGDVFAIQRLEAKITAY